MKDGIYADFLTSKGSILIELFYDKVPGTVANFIGLAEGQIKNDFKETGIPFYDNLKFHRVISDFMIQGGCPLGTGAGSPGYKFEDEFHDDLKHDKPGVLSMANSGPSSNGSQFFITHIKTPWLDKKHSVFGQVIDGQNIVNMIAQGDVINKISIKRKGQEAISFNAVKEFNKFIDNSLNKLEDFKNKEIEKLKQLTKGFTKHDDGLYYKIISKSKGIKPSKGKNVEVHYKGMLLDNTVFDSSYSRNEPIAFQIGVGQVIKGWDIGISLLSEGEEAVFVIPPDLAYGSAGAGGVIPPNSILIFEVKLLNVS
jgi:peptidyl-prolyl cis-trans isomerase A (cyclophilin A)